MIVGSLTERVPCVKEKERSEVEGGGVREEKKRRKMEDKYRFRFSTGS